MGTETSILALYGLFVLLVTVLQVLTAAGQVGLGTLSSPRDGMPGLTGVAGRMERALMNCVVGMALFAPAVLIVEITGAASGATLLAAQAFLIARVLYVPVYAAGIPFLRTGVWAVAFLANAYLYWAALTAAGGAPA